MRRWIGMVMAMVLALAVWVPAVGAESLQGTNLSGTASVSTQSWLHVMGVPLTGQRAHLYQADVGCTPAAAGGFAVWDTQTGITYVNLGFPVSDISSLTPLRWTPGVTSGVGNTLTFQIVCAPGTKPFLNWLGDQY